MDFRPDMDAHLAEKKRQYVRKKKKTKRIIIALMCIAILTVWILIGLAAYRILENNSHGDNGTTPAVTSTVPLYTEPVTVTTTAPKNELKITIEREQIGRGSLILVSELVERAYDFEQPQELVTLYGNKSSSYKIASSALSLNRETFDAVEKMFNAYKEETGNGDYQITEAHRTLEAQTSIYESFKEKYGDEQGTLLAAKPGYSEHHSGYAFDMNVFAGGTSYSLGTAGDVDPIYGWIYEHADEYGLVVRYPEGKTNVTGITNEPWHFRYVGKGHASYMKEHDLVLEEYVALLYKYPHDGKHLEFEYDGVKYDVCFVMFDKETQSIDVMIDADKPYIISGENSDGVIITQID